jgi:hypothetical protein
MQSASQTHSARWALWVALGLVREQQGWPPSLLARVVEGLQVADRQIEQREALLDTLVEPHLEVARLKGEQRHEPGGCKT